MIGKVLKLVVVSGVVSALSWTTATAQEFVEPTHANLVRTLVHYNALDLSNPQVRDEVGMMTHCSVYTEYYANEFEWNKFLDKLLKEFEEHRETLPTRFTYLVRVKLGRYNTDLQAFEFPGKSAVILDKFQLSSLDRATCSGTPARILPSAYVAVLKVPLKIVTLPVPEDLAKIVVQRLVQYNNNNVDRFIYMKFNVETYDVLAYDKDFQTQGVQAKLDARVDSVEVYDTQTLDRLVTKIEFERPKSLESQLNGSGTSAPKADDLLTTVPAMEGEGNAIIVR